VLVLALCSACMAPRPPAPPAVPPQAAAPAAPAPPAPFEIVVRKAAHTLSLYQGARLLKVYPVVFGKDPVGPKLYQGDHRTPEGVYHIVEKYHHPYWSRFMMLDYPTAQDATVYAWARRRGVLPGRGRAVRGIGGAIGIHGTEDESLNRRGINWTEGCISMSNHDVDELYALVPLGTRVVIGP
jgi:murein L,D-transpeptidase YafK